MSSQRSSSMDEQDNIRKRVCKACDRCRLKKSKCDGSSPCSRCKADNAICVFGERKKSQDKVYPKGYVEMLEQQQSQLVAGLRELYTRLQSNQGWPGQPLPEGPSGHPLTHDILERLDLLHSPSDNNSNSNSNYEGFEEDCSRMQHKLLVGGAPLSHRRGSTSSDSEHGHTSSPPSYHGTPTTRPTPYIDPFARNNAPPTPPMHSPFPRQSQILPSIKQESPVVTSTYLGSSALDPSALSRTWMNDAMMDEPMDFGKPIYNFDTFGNYDQMMMVDTMSMNPADPMMPDWNNNNDLDFASFLQNSVGA